MKNLLDSYLKENYAYEIKKALLSKESKTLTVFIRLNFIIPFNEIEKLKEIVKAGVEGIAAVDFSFEYEFLLCSKDEAICQYLDYIIHQVEVDHGAIVKSIDREKIEIQDDRVKIFALGEMTVNILNERVASIFERYFKEDLGYEIEVEFLNNSQVYEETAKEVEEAFSCVPVPRPKTMPKAKEETVKISSGKLLGRNISEEAVPMSSIHEGSGTVVLEGEVFSKENKTYKEGKEIVTLCFSDKTTSVCVKFFTTTEKWNAFDENVNSGDIIKVKGKIEWDNFANTIVLMAKDIQKSHRITREDHASEKRVELHAHTKMSSMDGLNELKDLLSLVKGWGHKAMAITDHGVAQSFPVAARFADEKFKIIYGIEGYVFDDSDCINEEGTIDYKKKKTNHIIILAKNQEGLKNLYKLISLSHLNYFYRRARIPKSVLNAHREGLILGSACEAGEIYGAVRDNMPEDYIKNLVEYYDYLEIQPLINNQFMIDKGIVSSKEDLIEINKKIIELGKIYDKPVVATCDSHYTDPEDYIYRDILMTGQGYDTTGGGKGLHVRTTEEMLKEFDYLDEETAREVVIHAPSKIADYVENIRPVPAGKFPPEIPNSDKTLRDTCEEKAAQLYGSPLPDKIRERLDKELNSIIGNGYAVMYVSAKMLVDKSMEDGFLVGSRGSVGSSFAATMAGITEVNPLAPHYICPDCKYLDWGDEEKYDCGVDMPEKKCPQCGTILNQDGFSIPFETFLGFEGDKEPDIDLNFAGEYQSTAHKFVDEIFGKDNVFKAGTIGTLADKTAYGYVMKYFEEKGIPINKYEANRLTKKCVGVKRTTGQHPGGIIIVPRDHEIYEFCPVQRPANDTKSDIVTTHFDYHSIDENLLKLDILGHDVPSMIRHLQDLTGIDPQAIPLKDEKVISIFNGTEGLNIKDKDYKFTHGSYGIPEFGTKFVRQMLDDTIPDKFADLVRISGFSHGTNVWLNNAQDFIRSGEATMREAISTRDDIMNYLILKGLPNKEAFNIMEKVRKGKGVTPEQEELMMANNVAAWYIESCKRISYMFPRAHAVAYVMMSYRIAYYKIYYPVAFYAVFLTTKIDAFNWEIIKNGSKAILERIALVEAKGKNATNKEIAEIIPMEIAYEMYSRGYEFLPPSLDGSKAMNFTVTDGKVVVPLCALEGVGETVGRNIEREQKARPFATIEEITVRGKANKTAIESLRNSGVLEGMQETDQISLF